MQQLRLQVLLVVGALHHSFSSSTVETALGPRGDQVIVDETSARNVAHLPDVEPPVALQQRRSDNMQKLLRREQEAKEAAGEERELEAQDQSRVEVQVREG